MKEDYLWDKSGDDAEIRHLENALSAFRCRETEPPALPQKVFTLEKPKRRGFFRLAFGLAAFASVVAVLSLFWFQLAGGKAPVAETVSETNAVNRANKTAGDSFIEPREITATVKPSEVDKPSAAVPKVVKIRQSIAPAAPRRQAKFETRNKKAVEPAETLTEEEQYAYDQLMLALTITSSKLKIVQDRINNVEEQNAVISGR